MKKINKIIVFLTIFALFNGQICDLGQIIAKEISVSNKIKPHCKNYIKKAADKVKKKDCCPKKKSVKQPKLGDSSLPCIFCSNESGIPTILLSKTGFQKEDIKLRLYYKTNHFTTYSKQFNKFLYFSSKNIRKFLKNLSLYGSNYIFLELQTFII